MRNDESQVVGNKAGGFAKVNSYGSFANNPAANDSVPAVKIGKLGVFLPDMALVPVVACFRLRDLAIMFDNVHVGAFPAEFRFANVLLVQQRNITVECWQ